MFDAYERIRIINLPARSDRRREMRQELRRAGLGGDRRVAFVEAVQPAEAAPWRGIGEKGCFHSHLNVLTEAAAAGESVLILEDDADFTREARLPQPPVDILWGGYTRRPEGRVEGSHCMGFSRRAVAQLVPFLQALSAQPSPAPIDGAYIEFTRHMPDLTVHFCHPMIALQRPSVSDIAGPSGLDNHAVARPILGLLRRFKREWQRHSRFRFQTQVKP